MSSPVRPGRRPTVSFKSSETPPEQPGTQSAQAAAEHELLVKDFQQADNAFAAYMRQMGTTFDKTDATRAQKGLAPAPRPTVRDFLTNNAHRKMQRPPEVPEPTALAPSSRPYAPTPNGQPAPASAAAAAPGAQPTPVDTGTAPKRPQPYQGQPQKKPVAPPPPPPPVDPAATRFAVIEPPPPEEELPPPAPTQPFVSPRATPEIRMPIPTTDPAEHLNPMLPKVSGFDVVGLPSRGIAYLPGAHIRYRAYMLGEIEEFESQTLSKQDRILLTLRGIECNFQKLDLTLSDLMYLGLLRRISSLGAEELNVNTKCPSCGGINTMRVATASVTGQPAVGTSLPTPVVFDNLEIPALPLKVKLTIGELYFKPITVGDYLALLDSGLEDNNVTMLAIQCHSLDWPESIEIFNTLMDPHDIRKLGRIEELFYHALAPIRVICQHDLPQKGGETKLCGNRYPVAMENTAEAFVYPFRSGGDEPDDEITFGV